ncbi:sigma factor G inhibitor Gin [Clostridium rectalis]|uniref:sigma factor G inhibitor Gin n=1 Tax=Clostridium rectalis TaxID=2040295 RepID=UPI000F63F339|nr:sigma factor G inhibitor Gin [Clostridium rectalis]
MKKRCCIVCGKPLKNGIIVNGKGVCLNCEQKIIKVNMDTDFYKYYKDCIKKFIICPWIRGEDRRCQIYHL